MTENKKNPNNFANWDKERLRQVGAKGGSRGRTGGFYNNPSKAAEAGRLGGIKSKRKPKYYVVVDGEKMSCDEAAEKMGISRTAIFNRRAKGQIEYGLF